MIENRFFLSRWYACSQTLRLLQLLRMLSRMVDHRPNPSFSLPRSTPAKSDDSGPGFSFPAVSGKNVTAAFDGGRLTSDGGGLLLAQAEHAMGLCLRLAGRIAVARHSR